MPQPAGKSSKNRPNNGAGKSGGARPAASPGIQPGARPPRTAVQYGPAGSALRKQADSGVTRKQSNRVQLIIGAIALVVIAVVVVVGIMLNKSNTETKNDGYGSSKSGVATLTGDVITLSTGTAGAKTIDIYEDPLCPICGAFEAQYGQQIAQAVDDGKLTVNYHFLNFLDRASASKDYSTRAVSALMCTASNLGSVKGLWASVHATLYDSAVQPEENASADLTNDQLNQKIAATASSFGVASGSPELAATQACVTNGSMVATAKSSYTSSAATLTAAIGQVATPAILSGGTALNVDNGSWLSSLLAG